MRGGDMRASDLFDGIVCPTCFAILAEESGIAGDWQLSAERVHKPLKMVTPDGRVWNETAWLWEGPA